MLNKTSPLSKPLIPTLIRIILQSLIKYNWKDQIKLLCFNINKFLNHLTSYKSQKVYLMWDLLQTKFPNNTFLNQHLKSSTKAIITQLSYVLNNLPVQFKFLMISISTKRNETKYNYPHKNNLRTMYAALWGTICRWSQT